MNDPLVDLLSAGASTGVPSGGIDPLEQALSAGTASSSGIHPAIKGIADRLGIDPDHLNRVIHYESGGNPAAVNPKSGATGLIQFMPFTAQGMGTSVEALRHMSIEQQAPYVEQYLRQNRATGKNFSDLYASVLYPVAVGKALDYPLFSRGSKAYDQNRQLDANHDGTVTKREAAQSAWGPGQMPDEQASPAQLDEAAKMGMRSSEIHAAQDVRAQQVAGLHARMLNLETEIARKEALGKDAGEGRKQLTGIFTQLRSLQGIPEPQAPAPDVRGLWHVGYDFGLGEDKANEMKAREHPGLLGGIMDFAGSQISSINSEDAPPSDAAAVKDIREQATHEVTRTMAALANLPSILRRHAANAISKSAGNGPVDPSIYESDGGKVTGFVTDLAPWLVAPLRAPLVASQAAAIAASAAEDPAGTAEGLVQSVNFFDPEARPVDRAIRFANAAMIAGAAGIHGHIALTDANIKTALVSEFGMSRGEAGQVVQSVRERLSGVNQAINLTTDFRGNPTGKVTISGQIRGKIAATLANLDSQGIETLSREMAERQTYAQRMAKVHEGLGPFIDQASPSVPPTREATAPPAPRGTAALDRYAGGAPVVDPLEAALLGDHGSPGDAPPPTPTPTTVQHSGLPKEEPVSVSGTVPSHAPPAGEPLGDVLDAKAPKPPETSTRTANAGLSQLSAEGIPFYEDQVNPNEVGVYPGLQYKNDGIIDRKNGITAALKDVDKYDHATAAPWTVWETTDGRKWVMNGHHRRELALRTGETSVPIKIFRESDGITFDKARGLGALQNIKDGKGTALDAATVLSDLGASVDQLRSYGVNIKSGLGRDAIGLQKLAPEALDLVRDGTVTEGVGAAIGDAGLSPERQGAMLREAARVKIETRRGAELLAERARNSPLVDKSGDTGSLFDVQLDLALGEQAKVSELAYRKLIADKRLFEAVVKGHSAGETSVDESAQRQAAMVHDVAAHVMATDPEVARILEKEAKSYAERPVKNQLDQAVRRVADAARKGAERRLAELGQVDAGGVGRNPNSGLHPGEGSLSPRQPESQPGEAQLSERPIGEQLSLDPENLGDQTGQLGWDLNRAPDQKKGPEPKQTPLPGTGNGPPAPTPSPEPPKAPAQRTAAKDVWTALKWTFGEKPVIGKETAMQLAREHGGDLARRSAIVEKQLTDAAKIFDRRTPEERLDFIDRMERGQSQPTAEDQQLSLLMRKLMDGRRDEVQALGTGKLETWIENYFPHLWADPKQAQGLMAKVFGKRPLEGSKSFLKQRTIPTIREGIEAGLVPLTDNPAEMVVAKIREMDRYILGDRLVSSMKERGMLKFTTVFTPESKLAEMGMAKIQDNAFTVFGPHSVDVPESFDPQVRRGLEEFAKSIGVDVKRVHSISKELGARDAAGVLGVSTGGSVMVKHFTDDGVLAHEIGHELDNQYGLGKWLTKNGGVAYDMESSALAEYRHYGVDVPDSYREYVQTPNERIANLIHAMVHAPELAERVAPTSVALLKEFLSSHDELKPLLSVKPSVLLETNKVSVPVPGLQTMGYYTAPREVAKILNAYLSPGMRSWAGDPSNGLRSGTGYLFRSWMGVNNTMNRANLGLSGFHAFTMMMEAMASDTALGLQELSSIRRGKPMIVGRALTNLAAGSVPITSMVRDMVLGKRLKMAYLSEAPSEAMAQIVKGLVEGGGRIHQDSLYQTGAAAKFAQAFRQRKIGTATLTLVPAVFDAVAKPIMELLVPHVKLGAFHQLFQFELDRAGPGIEAEEFRRIASGVWDSIDNRFGELVYDNLFWHRTAKDLGQVSVRALGWSLGTIREIGGGAYDVAGDVLNGRLRNTGLSRRSAYVMGLVFTAGITGAVLGYLMTGKRPETAKDCYFPKTGNKNADGTDERVSLPGYMKDVYAYKHDPVATISHKVSPLTSLIHDLLVNHDFWNEPIRNEDDPLVKQALDEMGHILKSFTPFTIDSELRHHDQTGKVDVASLMGVSPAAGYITKSPAHELALHYLEQDRPYGTRTHEEVQVQQQKKEVMRLYRNGKQEEAQKLLETLPLSEGQMASVYSDFARADSGELPFLKATQALRADQMLHVYDVGTKAEKAALAPVLIEHMQRDVESGRAGAMTEQRVNAELAKRPELLKLASG